MYKYIITIINYLTIKTAKETLLNRVHAIMGASLSSVTPYVYDEHSL